jgi:exopolyphosphatase/guanosine-5'-triphosphate,3'-diphosphate pyrophosphatase
VRCAVLDLGSTSFQLLVTDATPEGALTHVLRDRVILNLGAEVASSGRVPDDLLDRALHTVARFRDIAERAGAEAIWPVATSAFRDAANQPWLSKALRGALGVPVRILGGDEEVQCTVSGIRASVALPDEPWIAFDLGGGSLEIALVQGAAIRWSGSYPLGAARLARTMVEHDPMTRPERRELRRLVKDTVAPAVAACASLKQPTCIVAGGTAGALARLLAARRWPVPPTSLNQFAVGVDSLGELARVLGSSSLEERLTMPGIDERRADLLPAGSVVLATALEQVGAISAIHSEWGLREGVVLRELGAPIPTSPEQLRRGAVDRLARAWSTDDGHSAAVRRHADRLFDETDAFHDLGGVERELLGSAARIHDVGTRISPDKHHKHGAYVVEHAGLRGFSPDEVALMACIIRFQRGSAPRASYPPFAALTAGEREACRTLVGILRVAHALGRGGADDVTAIDIARHDDELEITVEGENPGGAIDDAAEQAPLLERSLGCSISFAVRHLG